MRSSDPSGSGSSHAITSAVGRFAKRFLGTISPECLDRMLTFHRLNAMPQRPSASIATSGIARFAYPEQRRHRSRPPQ